jgi:hypothetical protein
VTHDKHGNGIGEEEARVEEAQLGLALLAHAGAVGLAAV